MLESNLTLDQIAAAWLELWFSLQRGGMTVHEVRAQRQAYTSRKPVGEALLIAVGVGPHPEEGDLAVFTFNETRGRHGDDEDRSGYLLNFTRTGADGADEARLSAEIDIRGEWMRGTIVGINQGRTSFSQGLVVNGNIVPAVRLIDPWQLVYHNLTSGITDAQRFLSEQAERAAVGEGE